jgi:hypothetical protein
MLHDAPEYVIGDMISPFKAVIGGSYKVVEKRLLSAIHIRFGLPAVLPAEIEQQIKAAIWAPPILKRHLAGFAQAEARRLFGRDPKLAAATEKDYVTPWSAGAPKSSFWRDSRRFWDRNRSTEFALQHDGRESEDYTWADHKDRHDSRLFACRPALHGQIHRRATHPHGDGQRCPSGTAGFGAGGQSPAHPDGRHQRTRDGVHRAVA